MWLLLGWFASAPLAAAEEAPPVPPVEQPTPVDFVEMTVLSVVTTEAGPVVLLTDPGHDKVLPIWVGESEAAVIALRQERRRFERPLTHDLMDNVVRELGGSFVAVRIDDLLGGTFVAKVDLLHDGRRVEIDSRSSDAIAVALGHNLAILVSTKVLDEAGVSREDRERDAPPAVPDPGAPPRDIKL